MLALVRGERTNAVWFVFAALATYFIAYRFYAKYIERKICRPDDLRATPAETFNDGKDFVPTDRRVLYGHHFAAIAGAGPLVGPVMAAQMGYLPGTLWIIVGVVLAGAVQDYLVLFFSMRRGGRSLAQIARDELGRFSGILSSITTLLIMLIIISVLALIVVNALAESPWGVWCVAMTVPIAFLMGAYLRYLRPGKVAEVSMIGIILLLGAIFSGQWVAATGWGQQLLNLDKTTLAVSVIIYGFVAAVLPVWLLLAPRDYLSTFMKVGAIVGLAVAVVAVQPSISFPAVSKFADDGQNAPVVAGSLFPFLFITIACGALSGFHALISSGTTPKLIEKERQTRLIGYGGMLMESFVAIMAFVAALSIDQGIYYAINAPAGVTGGAIEGAVQFVNSLGLTGVELSGEALAATAHAMGESSVVSRSGGAPTLAVGMARIMQQFVGGIETASFWYHFAIMFEALFILTAIDAGTRTARFMLQEAVGTVAPKFRDYAWRPGAWICTAAMVAGWGSILLMGVTDPLGGINALFPLFGIANQLLAGLALAVCLVVAAKKIRHRRYLFIIAVPLAFTAAVTVTASFEKIFSPVRNIGYWAQFEAFRAAKREGKVSFGAAESPTEIDAVIRNTFIQGVLSIIFVTLVVAVMIAGIIATVQALRGHGLPSAEEPRRQSKIAAPAGFIATREDKKIQSELAGLCPCNCSGEAKIGQKFKAPELCAHSNGKLFLRRIKDFRQAERRRQETGFCSGCC